MRFGDMKFRERFARLGDDAEAAFESYADDVGILYQRYGFNRPPLTKYRYINEFVRNTPDYMAQYKKELFFIECKGTIYDHVKIKPDQLRVLENWHMYEKVIVSVYNSRKKQVTFLSLDEIKQLSQGLPIHTFQSDNKEYWEIPVTWNRLITEVL